MSTVVKLNKLPLCQFCASLEPPQYTQAEYDFLAIRGPTEVAGKFLIQRSDA